MNGYLNRDQKSYLCELIATRESLWNPDLLKSSNKGEKTRHYLEILDALSLKFGKRFKGNFKILIFNILITFA